MEVPEPNGRDGRRLFEIDLHPLEAVEEFDEVTFAGILFAISDEREFTDDRRVIAAGDGLAFREKDGALRDKKLGGRGGSLHEVGHVDRLGSAFDQFRWQHGGERDTTDGAT